MKIANILSEYSNDFTAMMECEHCGHTVKLTSGYHDNHYHARVIPAMRCKECGKNRAGELEHTDTGVSQMLSMEDCMERKPWEPCMAVKAEMIDGIPYVEARYLQECIAEIARLKDALADKTGGVFDVSKVKVSYCPTDFIPFGTKVVLKVDYSMGSDCTVTIKGFYDPKTGESHIQEVVHNVELTGAGTASAGLPG